MSLEIRDQQEQCSHVSSKQVARLKMGLVGNKFEEGTELQWNGYGERMPVSAHISVKIHFHSPEIRV